MLRTKSMRTTAAWAVGLLACLVGRVAGQYFSGQGADFSIPSDYTEWDNEEWTLTTRELIQGQYQSRMSLANGYFGCALAAAGPFFEEDKNLTQPEGGNLPINGWPLDNHRISFCTVANFWDSQPNTTRTNFPWLLQYGWESVISGVPHWGGIIFDVNGSQLDANVDNDTIRDFRSSFSAKHGVATWSYVWSPANADRVRLEVTYTAFVSRARLNVAAVRVDVRPSADVRATVTDLLDGRSAARTTFDSKAMYNDTLSIRSAVHPLGVPNVTAHVVSRMRFDGNEVDLSSRRMANQAWVPYANESTIAQSFDVHLRAGRTTTMYKFVGAASTDAFADAAAVARNASDTAEGVSWDDLLAEHEAAWESIMPPSTVDDFSLPDGSLPEDVNIRDMQISSIVTPHYLLQNSLRADERPNLADQSISVGGLTSESYGGMIFWDADLFMFPGLAVTHPEYARQMAEYRVKLAPQARANAVANGFSEDAILYPWTSGRYGNCTATGPCTDYQYHLNADIALMLLQYRNITGDEDWWREEAWPIYNSVAHLFAELLKYNETTQRYDIKNHTDPDEYANLIDNGAYTLAIASKTLTTANYFRELYGQGANETWEEMANNVAIPYDVSGITAEFRGMNNSAPIKQADIVLKAYPVDYENNYTRQQTLNDLDYYAGKQSPDGPAMTFSIISIVANEVSPSGCSAYTYALAAFEPYTRAPWYQFSEQLVDAFGENGGTNPAFPFLTGHGGFHQVGPFGWLGLRTDQAAMLIDPSLPPHIQHLRLRTIHYGGATIHTVMNYTHTTLTRVASNSSFLHDIYGSEPMPILVGEEEKKEYRINIGQRLIVENRRYSDVLTVANNVLQCLTNVTSEDPIRPGQYALAAIDGAISTAWQPLTPERASMVVDMSSVPPQPVVGISFNWGITPPVSANVILSNSSTFDGPAYSIPINSIDISEPLDITDPRIQPYRGNTTNVAIAASSPVYTGRYVKLEIQGTQGPLEEFGGSVAEFALIGTQGRSTVRNWEKVSAYTPV